MPNTSLTLANIRSEITTLLGGTELDIELGEADFLKSVKDAVRLYNHHVPRRNMATLPVTAAQQKYLISHPGLIGVVAVDFVGNGIQFGASTEFGPPFSNVSPTGLGIAGSTFGEVNNALAYAKMSQTISSAEPEWNAQQEGPNYYLYIYTPSVGTVNCSYEYSWGVTPDNDANTGMQYIPEQDVDWIINYATARCKRILGRILRKFGGVPNAEGGVDPLDGAELVQEATEEETELREEILQRRRPLPPVVG